MRTVAITGAIALAALAMACTEQPVPTAPAEQSQAAVPTFNLPDAPVRNVPAPSEPAPNPPAETAPSARMAAPAMALSNLEAIDNGEKMFVTLVLNRAILETDVEIERCPDDGKGAPDAARAVTKVMTGSFHPNDGKVYVLDTFANQSKGGAKAYWYRARHLDARGESAWSQFITCPNHIF